jgi:exopolysaccharide biosynthesis polyprenyl glycosylphosphotransferase
VRPTATTAAGRRPVNSAPAAPGLRAQLAARLDASSGRTWALARLALDTTLLAAAGLAAGVGARAGGIEPAPVAWVAVFGLVILGVLAVRGMYRARLRADLLDDLRAVVIATSLAAMTVLTLRTLLADSADLTSQVIRPWAFATVYVAAGRVALHWSQTQSRRHGEALRPTLIVGAGRIGRLMAKRLLDHPELGLRPIGFLDKEPMDAQDVGPVLPVLGASWDLDRVVEEQGVEHVIVCFSTAPDEVLLRLFRRCEELGVAVAFVPRLFEKVTTRLDIDYLGGIPLITARAPRPRGFQFAIKYTLDRIIAALTIVIVSPVLIAGALAVLLSSGRPIFFRQLRVGRDGKEFEMLKLRTMRGDASCGEADADWAVKQLASGDAEVTKALRSSDEDRQTRVGAILRGTSIDELPQLFNVLAGHMSLIGPRPERTHYVSLFEQNVYRYTDRHRVKSGITGWAQVNGLRGKTSLADRVEWDNYYIENWSLWLDLKIALRTVVAVFRSSRQVE